MVHEYSPKQRRTILYCWAALGVLIGAVLLNPENWIERTFLFIGGRNRPSPKYYEYAYILGKVVGGGCGLVFFGLGAMYVVHSRWHLRWVIGGSIAFFATIPATMLYREIFPTVDNSQSFKLYYTCTHPDIDSLMLTAWIIPGLVWGIGWWSLENIVPSFTNGRKRARYGAVDGTSQLLPVISRRMN